MQNTIVIVLVLVAVVYLGWRFYNQVFRKPGCGPDCGCEGEHLSPLKKK